MSLLLGFLASFFIQGSRRTPACGSHRLVVAFFWLYVIIIGATYSGNLVAFLATEKASFPFNSLQEMVEQNKYTFGTLGSTLFIDMLKVNTGGRGGGGDYPDVADFAHQGQRQSSGTHAVLNCVTSAYAPQAIHDVHVYKPWQTYCRSPFFCHGWP